MTTVNTTYYLAVTCKQANRIWSQQIERLSNKQNGFNMVCAHTAALKLTPQLIMITVNIIFLNCY